MARPTTDPTWATAGSPNVVEPTLNRSAGYPDGFPPPAAAHNWQFQTIGGWFDWVAAGASDNSLATAIANTAAGECFRLDPAGLPYEELAIVSGYSSTELVDIAMDAERFYLAFSTTNGRLHAYALGETDIELTGALWTLELASLAQFTKVVSNGTYVAVIFTTYCQVYDATDGSLVWSYDHTQTLYDVEITSNWVAFVGVANVSDVAGRIMDLSDGSVANLPPWGTSKDLFAVAAADDEVWVVFGEDDGAGQFAGGFSGGAVPIQHWRVDPGYAFIAGAQATSNGRFVFAHTGDTGARLLALSPATGETVWDRTITAAEPSMVCDAKDIYLALEDDDLVHVIDPNTGGTVRTLPYTLGVASTLRTPLATNSHQVMRGGIHTGPDAGFQVYASGLRTRTWIRESIAPHFNQASPEAL